jgi:uncharacterized protein (DUF1778 family)
MIPYNAYDMEPEALATAQLEARAISHAEIIYLSIEDRRQIAKALLHPAKPEPALKCAFERRRQLLGAIVSYPR